MRLNRPLNTDTTPDSACQAGDLPVLSLPRGKRRALVLRASRIGRKARRAGVSDRGTVLLMVLGVLALMAIVAVVYAAIGKGDRVSSASIVRNTRVDDQVEQIADYFSGVIRDGLFATYVEPDDRTTGTRGTLKWRGWDYGFTDSQMRSQPVAVGGNLGPNEYRFNPTGTYATPATGNGPDPRTPGVPFLASTEPAFMRAGPRPPRDAMKPYLDKRDWLNISNFAPSGNFVNLANLRNNFNCPSGFAATAGGAPSMSDQMSLLNDQGRPTRRLPGSTMTAEPRRPADWTLNQLGAFRPMFDDLPPEDPNHINNQWCDTDGDGFADARWCELVDIWNQDDPQSVIPTSGRTRLFVAARCVDLSGRVNVNTAGDLYLAPEQVAVGTGSSDAVQFLPGLTPGDVDLLRILRRTDATVSLGMCYDSCPQPTAANAAGDYTGFGDTASQAGGLAAYQAIWDFRDASRVTPQLTGTQVNRVPAPIDVYPAWTGASTNAPPTARERFRAYTRFGASADGVRISGVGSREVVSTFDTGDLLDLLSFESINDYGKRSRLEATTSGRSNFANSPSMAGYDPLRSNRPREVELRGRNSGDLAADFDKALLQADIDVRRLLTTISGDRPLASRLVPNSTGTTDPTNPLNNMRTDMTGIIEVLALPGNSTGLRQLRDGATRALFASYLDALMPYTDSTLFPAAWNPDPTLGGPRGLSYGGRAELAYMMSAALALNLREALDRTPAGGTTPTFGPADQAPAVFTLDINQAAARDTYSNNPTYNDDYPWPRLGPEASAAGIARLTTNNNYIKGTLPAASGGNEIRRNMFGIAPQPFMTQVMAINCYVDAPPNAGGDDDVSRNYDNNGNPQDPITINFDQSLSNTDFLFSVLAFQITNPFDVDVQIEPETLDNKSFYYVEYAGRTYRLRLQDPTAANGFRQTLDSPKYAAKLKAGETRVFYATFPAAEAEVESRVNTVRTALASRLRNGAGNAFSLASFVNQQFGDVGREPVHIAAVYPETGVAVRNNGGSLTNVDLQATNTSYEVPLSPGGGAAMPTLQQGRAERRVVNLWRVMRDETRPDNTNGLDSPTANNSRLNDQLVDRLHDPSDPAAFPDGVLISSLVDPFGQGNLNQDISGTKAGDDSTSEAAAQDNTGFSFANFASISRPTNPTTVTADSPKVAAGAMPIWCFETKADNEFKARGSATLRLSLNKADRALGAGAKAAFVGAGRRVGHQKGLKDLVDELQGSGQARLDLNMQRKAEDKTNNPYDRIDTDRITQLAALYGAQPADIKKSRYKDVAPVIHRVAGISRISSGGPPLNGPLSTGNYEYNSRALFSRVGDFLLPLAIGPSYDPAAVGNDTNAPNITANVDPRIKNLEARWITLAEALALATDYYTPTDVASPFYHFARDTRGYAATGTPPELPKADHGCLSLDAWVPYIERGSNTQFDPGIDETIGNGIPLALNVLDRFRVGGMPAWYGQAAYGEVNAPALGAVNRLIPGRININTAPLAVLRALSLLSPELLQDPLSNGWLNQKNISDPTRLLAASVNPTTGVLTPARLWDPSQPRQNWDIAAAIVAWRDKLMLKSRATAPGGPTVELNFRDDRTVAGRTAPAGMPAGTPWGRGSASDIPGIREARGFKSVGEVMAVQMNYSTDAAVIAAAAGGQPIDKDNSITRLGQDGLANYSPALDASVAKNPNNGHFGPNGVADDYAEKLTIANAILNNITVRSDVFAVWFVINGYTPEDVAVEDGFPMVPSVARRYLMVVDRSNVTDPSMKPRIVMLREVPLK